VNPGGQTCKRSLGDHRLVRLAVRRNLRGFHERCSNPRTQYQGLADVPPLHRLPYITQVTRESRFSYLCNQCGRCCRDKVITISPYDLIRIARAAGLSTAEAIGRYTLRRGSLLLFNQDGKCAALEGVACTIHNGRPLACRLYPLGLEHDSNGSRFIALDPAAGSAGVYGNDSTVAEFVEGQGVASYFAGIDLYAKLIERFRDRIIAIADFDKIELADFRRRAIREALAESNYDYNPLIDALFEADSVCAGRVLIDLPLSAHIEALSDLLARESDPFRVASASAMLALSLGYRPDTALVMRW